MPLIFICYRRKDAAESASRLNEALARGFGADYIFLDRTSIHGGLLYREQILEGINSSTTFLVVIGRDWLTISRDNKRLLDDEDDIVRWEIATALERADKGEDLRVIPVLVEDARCPEKEDLPEVLKSLVEHHCLEISRQNWRKDIKPLLQLVEKDFTANFLRTFFGGVIAGLIAGVVVSCLYNYQQKPPDQTWVRILIGGVYGLFAGAVLSYCINAGITWRSRLFRKRKYSKIIDGTASGALGGILAGTAGGLLFDLLHLGGKQLDSRYLMLAVAFSSVIVALGILLPELKGLKKAFLIIVIVMCVTLVAATIIMSGFDWLIGFDHVDMSAFSQSVMILGTMCGMMSGFQVGSTLFVYDRVKDRLGK